MALEVSKLRNFAVELYKINAVKFGEYKTKVGLMTPVYCDLRVIISYPKLMATLADLLIEKLPEKIDVICGVPYTALPIATSISLKTATPMVMRRKEAKDYGTKKLIEGVFETGNECLIIEDVVTSGSSILETVKDLTNAGLKCTNSIVLLDREQGGRTILENNGIKMHSLLTLTELIGFLKEANCIGDDMVLKVKEYLRQTQVDATTIKKPLLENRLKMSFESRIPLAKNPVAANLLRIMSSKQTTLCLAADLTDATALLNLAEETGPYICALKTHIDIINDFNESLIGPLRDIARRHNFLLFEDRKYADIGKTVQLQYSEGIYKTSSWADLITVHSIAGTPVLDAIRSASGLESRGVFLVAQLSSSGNLIDADYTKNTIKLAEENQDLVVGLVCQMPLVLNHPGLMQLTPGVKINKTGDGLGQIYDGPESVVLEKGADVAVVGRGITEAADKAKTAKTYKELLWKAYENRIL
ncbi:uridine 5'-monophosphate synthase isoform X2 [Aethina tumida]|uniref:uridine 5'-monophosphate synthase isoform X2 n=1 Tax=Aethina tumida TaxID=116153 RepID=UPI0021483802|nr:uridine 5'-monophosphate synthase isoform X2 [Aethina tumida]XP_049817152.1 uridine 5'-monophosphate synthase isoform X2 [Aethina tumida]